MRTRTRQDHIHPLVQEINKCHAAGCGPNSIQVFFTRPRGYIKDFEPVWVCSSGHCSDYDEIPSLRRPEDCPATWVEQNAREVVRALDVMKCDAHAPMGPADIGPDMNWGQSGHLYLFDGHTALCLPQS